MDPKQPGQKDEGALPSSPRLKRALAALLCVLGVLVVVGAFQNWKSSGLWSSAPAADPLSTYVPSAQAGAVTCTIPENREFKGGAALSQLLENFEPASHLSDVVVPVKIEYRFSLNQEWESQYADEKWSLVAPAPEGPLVRVDDENIKWSASREIAKEEADVLRQMLTEKTILVVRSDEAEKRDQWLQACRTDLIKSFGDWAAGQKTFNVKTVELRISGAETP